MNRIVILFSAIALIASTACGTMKKSDSHNKDDRIKMDALAMAQKECKNDLYKMMAKDSVSDINQQNVSRMLGEEVVSMRRYYFNKYNQNDYDIKLFNELKEKLGKDLTVCKDLEAYKLKKAEIEEAAKKEDKK